MNINLFLKLIHFSSKQTECFHLHYYIKKAFKNSLVFQKYMKLIEEAFEKLYHSYLEFHLYFFLFMSKCEGLYWFYNAMFIFIENKLKRLLLILHETIFFKSKTLLCILQFYLCHDFYI